MFYNMNYNISIMKKLVVFTLLTIISLGAYAQEDPIKRATTLTNTMTKALSLNKEEQTKVYQIQLERFQKVLIIKEQYQDNPETKKAKLKNVYNKLYGKLKGNLGEEKMLLWQNYKRNN